MLLRPRQKICVQRAVLALSLFGNTLVIAAPAAGKTVMFAEIVRLFVSNGGKALILTHSDVIKSQNHETVRKICPHLSTSFYDASTKSFEGDVVFASVQTLSRLEHIQKLPQFRLLVIDEAHRSVAPTYLRIVKAIKDQNNNVKILGVTATPLRGDKQNLNYIFDNVCDQIFISELIKSGHLVPCHCFIRDVGVEEKLNELNIENGECDMNKVAKIMDTASINSNVVSYWKKKAIGRKTVVFCSTIKHATSIWQSFTDSEVEAVLLHCSMDKAKREKELQRFETGTAQVIVNVGVLAEGWNYPPTSCVVLLRPISVQSTMIQMIGRGLRTVDAVLYPDVLKTDCIVLDFGVSLRTHCTIEQQIDLSKKEFQTQVCPQCRGSIPRVSSECHLCGHVLFKEEFQTQVCPQCLESIPLVSSECDFCGNVLGKNEKMIDIIKCSSPDSNVDFRMTEFDLQEPKKKYIYLDGHFRAVWIPVLIFLLWCTQWQSVMGIPKGSYAKLRAIGPKKVCLAAVEDFINTRERTTSSRSIKTHPPTQTQLDHLSKFPRETKFV